jgi:hypothetical protein
VGEGNRIRDVVTGGTPPFTRYAAP